MRDFIQRAIALEELITQTIMGFIVLLVFIAAFTRYIGYPINWSVDIAQALFVWAIYLGANQAWRSSKHIGIEVLFNRFPQKARFYLQLFLYFLIALFLVSIIASGIHISIVNVGRIIGDLPVSYSFVTIAVPVGSFLMPLPLASRQAPISSFNPPFRIPSLSSAWSQAPRPSLFWPFRFSFLPATL